MPFDATTYHAEHEKDRAAFTRLFLTPKTHFQHLSSRLADCLEETWPVRDHPLGLSPAVAIATFLRLYELTEEIGWAEHTCDWDPYIEVATVDGYTYSLDDVVLLRSDPNAERVFPDSQYAIYDYEGATSIEGTLLMEENQDRITLPISEIKAIHRITQT